ncbi:hypothetical protein [Mycobacteroides chelonae]|uniref:hypothetical protein n=1 Tax=Mycobacteroides chelonae TaxID=1774 RepID=UPI0012FF6BCC|nr:hypothetical protein [Mycobacteroides chelonae]
MKRNAALVLIAAALVSGCTQHHNTATRQLSVDSTTAATPDPPSQVTVPATKVDLDPSYEIRNTATVSNDVWPDGTFGRVIVMAKRGESTSNRGPLLTGTVKLSDGSKVECERFRSTIWSDFDQFEPLDMRCKTKLDLATVAGVDLS